MNGSRGIVLAAGGVMLVLIARRPGGLVGNYKSAWAAGAVLLGLSLIADVWPQGAAPLSVLVVLGTIYKTGTGSSAKPVPSDQSTGGHQAPQAAGGSAARPGRVTSQ